MCGVPPIHELATERLRLRQWTAEDRAPFARLNGDPEVMRHFPAPLSVAESDAMADRLAALIAERGWGLWAAEATASRTFIGFIGLHVPTAPLPFAPCVEIGWRLDMAWWGRGLATEGARAALDFAFDVLRLDEVVSFTALTNVRSEAVMCRLGMRRDPETFAHPSVPQGHPLREHCLYRVRRTEWPVRVKAVGEEGGAR